MSRPYRDEKLALSMVITVSRPYRDEHPRVEYFENVKHTYIRRERTLPLFLWYLSAEVPLRS